ncbi:craniofacial development protein 2-like [Rhopilema esculentum]|uniref:craniofacial development protein 2-like n=1 Tax=Rhopilema esculentum TaxID=499914 RepID=UPI0031D73A65|eukprot:gene8229-14166_t
MVVQQNKTSYRIVRRAGHQGTRYPVGDQAGHDKYATGKQSHNMRNQLRIGTWNVRKMKELGKLETICRELSRSKIQILGIAETNWNNCGSFVRSGDSFKVVYSGKEAGYSHGTALILAKEAANALIGYSPIPDRILKVCIRAKPYNLSIVQCYAPTGAASDEDLEEFYSQLQETLDAIPSRDIKIVMGDMNAKVGTANTATSTYGTCGLGIRNERGESLIDFCGANELVIANTLFDQHPRRLYTWTSPDRTNRNQIDYIMIEQKWKSCLKDARTLPGADCNSDHQLLSAKLQMRLKKIAQPPPTLRLDFSTLDEKYKVKINNKFQALLECDTEEIPPDSRWKLGKE